MADVIRPDDRGPARVQRRGDVLVAADVLAVPVHEHDQPRRRVQWPVTDLDAANLPHGHAGIVRLLSGGRRGSADP